ncbi:MAG: hypothetical protein PHF00_12510 [Elusimicrobia bacterium]|nr:hypothetical protein [Elusimicrobiota bacterium]
MAKRSNLRTAAEADAAPPANAAEVPRVTITVPFRWPPEGVYLGEHVEVRMYDSLLQRRVLKGLGIVLSDAHCRLENGRHVDTPPNVIRWLLERIGRAAAP